MKYLTLYKCLNHVKSTHLFETSCNSFGRYLSSTMTESKLSGAPLQVVVENLIKFAPLSLGESWDNVGLLVEPSTPTLIKNILLTNDLTENVMEEAIDTGVNMIISYHPPIFAKLNRITSRTWKERIIAKCLEHRIAVFSPHTSWDSVEGGVADWLIRALPVKSVLPIFPHEQRTELKPVVGAGRIASLDHTLTVQEAVDFIKKRVQLPHVRIALARGKSMDSSIKTIAVCPGSGTTVLRGVEADLYLTGEMGHHDVLDAVHTGVNVVLVNHADSERGFLPHFAEILQKSLAKEVNVCVAKQDRDPLETV